MTVAVLVFPILVCLAGAIVAALFGLPALSHRLPIARLSPILALAPLSAFLLLLSGVGGLDAGEPLTQSIPWLPSLDLNASLYLDGLSALFALLVTGIGVLVVVYAGYYFKGDPGAWRFLAYILLFMTSMLGLVLAGDVITLFVFWEGTSITSFLLVAYKYKDAAARRGAFKALFITGGGGVALLAGLLFVSLVSGGADFATILSNGDVLRQSQWYPVMLGLIAFGAFTKSAQTPAHIWLPDAMSAPTPASAYLHSATMVKAGIYLMARLNPALGNTDLWFWLLSLVGLWTMLTGAYVGLKQNDLKALLAYSTISQLGVLMMLIGQDTEIAFKALVISVVAHALYKSALFLVVGIVDHEAGTRDLRRLGGLRRAMPATFAIGSIAALSMAGLPPLFGFLAKETLLATATHPNVPEIVDVIFPAAAVIAGALLLVQAGLIVFDTFLGRPRATLKAHEAPRGMWLMPAIPAALSLAIGLLPEPEAVASFLAGAATAAYGATVKVSLALWTGISVPLLLSVVAVSLGSLMFVLRARVRALQMRLGERLSFDALYAGALRLIDGSARLATRVQNGHLRLYLSIMLIGIGGMIALLGGPPLPERLPPITLSMSTLSGEIATLRVFTLLLAVAAAAITILLKRDFLAVLALSASGLSVAVLMVLEPAPDVALVQVVVDILITVILVLLLTRLPRAQRERAAEFTYRQSRPGLARDGLLAIASGIVMAAIVFAALTSRPRQSIVTPFYEGNAKPLTGATDIVGAIVVDFRGFDTLIEIAVFSMAGIAVYTLLRYASRKAGDEEEVSAPAATGAPRSLGIGGARTSPFVRMLAFMLLPLALVIAATHMLYGHDQPGDGFTAGVVVGLTVGFWYVVFGYYGTKRRLIWLKSAPLIASGLLLAVASAVSAALIRGSFFAPVDFAQLLGLAMPRGVNFSTSFLFEVSIFLCVLGSVSYVIDTLGRPKDVDAESRLQIEEIAVLERAGVVTTDEVIRESARTS